MSEKAIFPAMDEGDSDQATAVALAMAGASLCAGQRATVQKATVTICIDPDPHVLMGVRPLASAMFASIGVKIDWRERDSLRVRRG